MVTREKCIPTPAGACWIISCSMLRSVAMSTNPIRARRWRPSSNRAAHGREWIMSCAAAFVQPPRRRRLRVLPASQRSNLKRTSENHWMLQPSAVDRVAGSN
jgi:hypothetical protein